MQHTGGMHTNTLIISFIANITNTLKTSICIATSFILQIRTVVKLISTFIDICIDNNKLHYY